MGNLNLKLTGIVAAAALLLTPVANAQLSLSLDDGNGNTAYATDAGNTGVINLNTALGNWTANITSWRYGNHDTHDDPDQLNQNRF